MKTIQLPEDRPDDEPVVDVIAFMLVDLNAPAEGRDGWQVVAKDQYGNKLYAPPSRYSVWRSHL